MPRPRLTPFSKTFTQAQQSKDKDFSLLPRSHCLHAHFIQNYILTKSLFSQNLHLNCRRRDKLLVYISVCVYIHTHTSDMSNNDKEKNKARKKIQR